MTFEKLEKEKNDAFEIIDIKSKENLSNIDKINNLTKELNIYKMEVKDYQSKFLISNNMELT